eukprot:TRINITY_DN93574_c0_g1_i1.p1 TRINITY_DN93574_c0_g1~~TRINITY_DN93574_c0_g1_i1.p1  ORF type:complete len:530 (+),score=95.13 TRINITY_DN93574_c0_g1_i1:148-1590(+)
MADAVTHVYYNGIDVTKSVTGNLTSWTSTKKLKFRRVQDAVLVISGKSTELSKNTYCLIAGLAINCTDGTKANSPGIEGYSHDATLDAAHVAGLGDDWGPVCISGSKAFMIEDSSSGMIWAESGKRYASFRIPGFNFSATGYAEFTHFLVYGRSSYAEQTTPAALEIVDGQVVLSGFRFKDIDIGRGEIAGEVRWKPDAGENFVSEYNLYMASHKNGTDKSFLASASVGTNFIMLPQDTMVYNYSYLVLYTKTLLSEIKLPSASLDVWDEFDAECGTVPGSECDKEVVPVGTCSPVLGCSKCGLTSKRMSAVDAATGGPTSILAAEDDEGGHEALIKFSRCGISNVNVTFYSAVTTTMPAGAVPEVRTCRHECQPGKETCKSCIPPPKKSTTDTQADADGKSVWRYLACKHLNITNPTDTDLGYSWVFANGYYLGPGAVVASALDCDKLSVMSAQVQPFDLSNVLCDSATGVCSLAALEV